MTASRPPAQALQQPRRQLTGAMQSAMTQLPVMRALRVPAKQAAIPSAQSALNWQPQAELRCQQCTSWQKAKQRSCQQGSGKAGREPAQLL